VDMGADNLNIDTSKSIDDWLDHPGEANITVKDFKYEFGAYVPPPTASSADFAEECDFGGVSTITNTYNDRGSYFGDYDNVGESGTTIYTLSNGEVTDVRSDSDDPQWMLENMMEVFLENTACAANILKGVYSYKLNPLISVSGFNRDNTWFHSGMRYDGNPRNGTWTRIQVSGDVTIYEERYPQRDFDGTPLGSYAVQYYEVYTATGFLKKEIAIPEIEGEVSTALPIEEMLDMASDLGYGTDEYTY